MNAKLVSNVVRNCNMSIREELLVIPAHCLPTDNSQAAKCHPKCCKHMPYFKGSWYGIILFVVYICLLLTADSIHAAMIELRSGNGLVGDLDIDVTMLVAPSDGPWGRDFAPADFAAARTGPSAFIVSPNPKWKDHLDFDSRAKWISTGSSGSVSHHPDGKTSLYAINFVLPPLSLASVALDFQFLVDDDLGDLNNEGLFVNELPLFGSRLPGDNSDLDHFQIDQSLPTFDTTPLLVAGLIHKCKQVVLMTSQPFDQASGLGILPIRLDHFEFLDEKLRQRWTAT